MSLSKSEKFALDELIAKGDLVGAQNLIGGKVGAVQASIAEGTAAAEPASPRTLEEILLALVEELYLILGSRPSLTPLLEELRTAVTPKTEG